MKTGETRDTTPIILTVFPLISMLAAIIPSIFNNTSGIDTAKIGIITLLLTGAVAYYIRENAEVILSKKNAMLIVTVTYIFSICLLLLIPAPEVFCFWMVGGLLVSMMVDNKLGLLLHFNLSFIMGIMITKGPEQLIQVLIMGVLLSMLSGAMRQKTTVIYASIIILSTNMTLAFAFQNFIFDTITNFNYFKSLFSILTVLITAYFVYALYNRLVLDEEEVIVADLFQKEKEQVQSESILLHANSLNPTGQVVEMAITSQISDKNMEETTEEASNVEASSDSLFDYGARTSYEILCDIENDLLKQLKQYSESLYEHALHIGDLSKRAAREIGADEVLAMAGGLYHEIGKIRGKNYIEEGVNLAKEYSFPKELELIIKQHNINHDKPSFVEAAIVMLSDSVVSTIEYIGSNEDQKFSSNKIIENIFQLRMEKGTFDASSLSLKDYKILKEFYQKEFGKEHGSN